MSIKSKIVYFKIIDPRTIRITGDTKSIREHKADSDITAVETNSGKIFTIGDVVKIENTTLKVNMIRRHEINDSLVYDLCTAKKNKSSLLLMPMLGAVKHLFFYDQLLINCFIGTKEEGEGSIGLLYKVSKDPLFSKFITAIKQFKSFNAEINVSNELIYLKFNTPKKFKNDYIKFIEGKYSTFSSEYKDTILKFHDADIESQIAQILYKGKSRKKQLESSLGMSLDPDAELFSVIDRDLELFDKNYYI